MTLDEGKLKHRERKGIGRQQEEPRRPGSRRKTQEDRGRKGAQEKYR